MFPVEIHLRILKKADNATVRACVLVSKEFYGIATEVLRQRKALRNVVRRWQYRSKVKRLPYDKFPLAEMVPLPDPDVTAVGFSLCWRVLDRNPHLFGVKGVFYTSDFQDLRFFTNNRVLVEDIVVHHKAVIAGSITLEGDREIAVDVQRLSAHTMLLRPVWPINGNCNLHLRGIRGRYTAVVTFVLLGDSSYNAPYFWHNADPHEKAVYLYLMHLCRNKADD